jgi:hypothetical protein
VDDRLCLLEGEPAWGWFVGDARREFGSEGVELIETRLDAIRSDGTAHAMRLQRLLPSLIEDFGAEKPAEEIRACADLMLQPFDDAPVRSFVLTLARRNAHECLREGRCADLV